MRILQKCKDGGPDSPVDAYVLIEIKPLFSIMLLKFNKGGRVMFHSHAFHAWTWFLFGSVEEERIYPRNVMQNYQYKRSIWPKVTLRDNLHRVKAYKDSWVFTVRGPWCKTWMEYDLDTDMYITLTHGRKEVKRA